MLGLGFVICKMGITQYPEKAMRTNRPTHVKGWIVSDKA